MMWKYRKLKHTQNMPGSYRTSTLCRQRQLTLDSWDLRSVGWLPTSLLLSSDCLSSSRLSPTRLSSGLLSCRTTSGRRSGRESCPRLSIDERPPSRLPRTGDLRREFEIWTIQPLKILFGRKCTAFEYFLKGKANGTIIGSKAII